MILISTILIFISHISISSAAEYDEPLIFPEFPFKSNKDHMREFLSSSIDSQMKDHIHSGHNPVELLLKAELSFLVNLGIRLDILTEFYNNLYSQTGLEGDKLMDKLEPLSKKLFDSITLSAVKMSEELQSIIQKYEEMDFRIEIREPRSFFSLEPIKDIFEYINQLYEEIRNEIQSKVKDGSLKEKLLWSLKTKTSLVGLSTQIMFTKMLYDLGLKRRLKMRFIFPGIYYLLVFENGLIKRILENDLEEQNDFFNNFIQNYESSIEELTQRALFHIKEDELPKQPRDKLHMDLENMHKDFREFVKPLITINGAVLKEIKL